MLYGYVYVTPTYFTDLKQIEEWGKLFFERTKYYYDHWDEALENLRRHLRATSKGIEEIRFEDLPDNVPEGDIIGFRGSWDYTEMEKKWRRVVDLWQEAFDVHFEIFNLSGSR